MWAKHSVAYGAFPKTSLTLSTQRLSIDQDISLLRHDVFVSLCHDAGLGRVSTLCITHVSSIHDLLPVGAQTLLECTMDS